MLRGKVNVSTFRTARPAATGGGGFFGGFMGAGGVKANTMLGQVEATSVCGLKALVYEALS